MSEIIHLTPEQRQSLTELIVCPKCGSHKFIQKVVELKGNPMFSHTPILQCDECGYWTNLFDGWIWYPESQIHAYYKKTRNNKTNEVNKIKETRNEIAL